MTWLHFYLRSVCVCAALASGLAGEEDLSVLDDVSSFRLPEGFHIARVARANVQSRRVQSTSIMAATTGAFELLVSDDLSNFEPENIKKFSAIFFNNTNNEIFFPENPSKLASGEKTRALAYDKLLKKSFSDYLAAGGGLVAIHAGAATFRKWPEFGKILRAGFKNHPWYSAITVTLKVEEPDHPVARAFKGPTFVVIDEIYQFKSPYSRDQVRVILSIDTEKTDMTKEEIVRTDNDFAMSWVKSYGKGRVFYTALGHDHANYWNSTIFEHLLSGIQFAVGDLEADTTSSRKVKRQQRNQ